MEVNTVRTMTKKTPKKMTTNKEHAMVGLDCTVTQGMFSTERGISITLADGAVVIAVVDATDVYVQDVLKPGQEVRGKVRAYVVEERKETLLVDLPQPTLTSGPRLEVSRAIVG